MRPELTLGSPHTAQPSVHMARSGAAAHGGPSCTEPVCKCMPTVLWFCCCEGSTLSPSLINPDSSDRGKPGVDFSCAWWMLAVSVPRRRMHSTEDFGCCGPYNGRTPGREPCTRLQTSDRPPRLRWNAAPKRPAIANAHYIHCALRHCARCLASFSNRCGRAGDSHALGTLQRIGGAERRDGLERAALTMRASGRECAQEPCMLTHGCMGASAARRA